MTTAALLLPLCLFLVKEAAGACNYVQNLTEGATYYVYNPNYPDNYRGSQSCQWVATAPYRVKLTCNTFSIPQSLYGNCTTDRLEVRVSGVKTLRYCGTQTFDVESESNTMVINFNSPLWSPGGKFLCELQAVQRKQEQESCRCGWKNPNRIVGGTNTGVNEYPMMAGLVDFVQRILYCGATIISQRYVLTAAHCVVNRTLAQFGVVVGEHDVSTGADTNATVLYRTAAVRVHPQYSLSNRQYDIAVVIVDGIIRFTNEVGPACLPFQHQPDTFGGNFVDILGWGTKEFAADKADILQKATVSVTNLNSCVRYYPEITTNQLCTYAQGKDACQFDSGGPVLWMNPTSRQLVHIGIISYGIGCAGNPPAVNVRVGAHIDWIVSVTPDAQYCQNE